MNKEINFDEVINEGKLIDRNKLKEWKEVLINILDKRLIFKGEYFVLLIDTNLNMTGKYTKEYGSLNNEIYRITGDSEVMFLTDEIIKDIIKSCTATYIQCIYRWGHKEFEWQDEEQIKINLDFLGDKTNE